MIQEAKLFNFVGVSGSGKSTLACQLARELSAFYLDSDQHHVDSARQKLAEGEPLLEAERAEWIRRCQRAIEIRLAQGQRVVGDASLLRRCHRDQFRKFPVQFFCLHTPRNVALERIAKRLVVNPGHVVRGSFSQFVDSQLSTFEYPLDEYDITMLDSCLPLSELIHIVECVLRTAAPRHKLDGRSDEP